MADDEPMVRTMRAHFGKQQQLREYAKAEFDEEGWRIYPDLDDALNGIQAKLEALPGGGADALLGFSQVRLSVWLAAISHAAAAAICHAAAAALCH